MRILSFGLLPLGPAPTFLRKTSNFLSLALLSSKTSTVCSTLLLAESSSLPTVTLTGLFMKVSARPLTAGGQVAENIEVFLPCSLDWHRPIINLMSGSKPLSSILSASSNTKKLTLERSSPDPSVEARSLTLPGVPTTILIGGFWERRAFCCSYFETPPYRQMDPIPRGSPILARFSWVWMANSLVGATTKIETWAAPFPFLLEPPPWLMRCWSAGTPKANVFPELKNGWGSREG